MTGRRPMPVVLVAGLHAEARATTVAHLLRAVPGSVAVHHDLSSAADGGPVRRLTYDAVGELDSAGLPATGGCGCCTLREDLPPLLAALAAGGTHSAAVVELWDAVEPRGIADLIDAYAREGGGAVRLTGVLTAVDPGLVLPCLSNGDDLSDAGLAVASDDHRVVADTFARQLEYPPVLAVADSAEADAEGRALLHQLHPTARRIGVGSAALPGLTRGGFDAGAAAAALHPACARLPQEASASGVTTLVWRRRRPFHPERLYLALEDIACAVVRSRGRFWLADRPDVLLSWDAAGGALGVESHGPWLASLPEGAWDMAPPERRVAAALDWHPQHGDRGQHLVFTGPGLDRDHLVGLLDSCLLTPSEFAAGPAFWKRLPAVFDTWLDPVN
ncbi:CobW family GTP-binding protein [Streptomyces johnsoniae]|uniref:GTP-binding protein n=1 Tax=Streptomyces johnsoniae TaxID=3075532 RepID=A0ABU2SCP4_9ACTN|nr:GTP-binding protein [Streptomyces sp. DSM 41886]MDT0446583.1 GTP-binding protein [Streptomyces sp. DSM 41886]